MRRMITTKQQDYIKDLQEKVEVEASKVSVKEDLDVVGALTVNGAPVGGGGSKIYKHTLSNVGIDNENTRIIIYSTSSDLINDQYKLQYNTENWLRADYVYDITQSQRTVYQILATSFSTSQYKLYVLYVTGSTSNPVEQTQIKIATYTDTVEEI